MGEDGFAWDNLPAPLMRRLQRDLHLGSDPAADLRQRYGDTPAAVFVQDAWPALRDVWLREDSASRARVVAALAEEGEGDLGVLGRPDGVDAFLSSLVDSRVLQRVVTAELVELGSGGGVAGSPGIDADSAWRYFTAALVSALGVLEEGHHLVLAHGDAAAELVAGGDATARPASAGSAEQSEALGLDAAAASVVETLRAAGVALPVELTYRAVTEAGEEILLPSLGISRIVEADTAGRAVVPSEAAADVRHQVEETICQAFDLEEVRYDTDGDIPLRFGSAMIFVRITDDTPVVRVFAPMLWEVPESSELLRAVNELNLQIAFARVAWDGRQVSVRTEFVAHPFDPMQLMAACQAVGGIADHFDDRLQGRFGGRIFFGKAMPTKEAGYEYGGYL